MPEVLWKAYNDFEIAQVSTQHHGAVLPLSFAPVARMVNGVVAMAWCIMMMIK
jgi:hypothetical protein